MQINPQIQEIIVLDKSRKLLLEALENLIQRISKLFSEENDPFNPDFITSNSQESIRTIRELVEKIKTKDGNQYDTIVGNNMRLIEQAIWRYKEDLENAKNHIIAKKVSAILPKKLEESLGELENMGTTFRNAITNHNQKAHSS